MLLPYPKECVFSDGRLCAADDALTFVTDDSVPAEGYEILISGEKAEVRFSDKAGRSYALQTLSQLRDKDGALPYVQIKDAPAFSWRGFMIDSSRHIQTVDEIKRFIDAAASYKLNVFHWHLTDDPGWRIESEVFPRLSEVGAYRNGWGFGNPNPEVYGGYFKKSEIRDIIDFCAQRNITVVPEVDIPGHCAAVLKSYPYLSCKGEEAETTTVAGVFDNVLCPGKDETFDFCFRLLDELMDLFPGKYIHIGGDEVPKDNWNACPLCKKRMEEEGLADGDELQAYFTARIASYLLERGRIPLGWNEVLRSARLPGGMAVSKWWDPDKTADAYANAGGKIVMEETAHVYLDYPYDRTSLEQTCRYDLQPDTLTEEGKKNVLGIEAPIWTEWVEDFDRMSYMCFPRLLAVAEIGWTGKPVSDYPAFRQRAEAQRGKLAATYGIKMAPISDWDPSQR